MRITEAQFQEQVTDLAQLRGWQFAHFRPAMTKRGWRTPVSGTLGAGFPDLVLVRPRDGRLIFAELKRVGAIPTLRQTVVLDLLRTVAGCSPSVEVYLWYPSDIDAIGRVLL